MLLRGVYWVGCFSQIDDKARNHDSGNPGMGAIGTLECSDQELGLRLIKIVDNRGAGPLGLRLIFSYKLAKV